MYSVIDKRVFGFKIKKTDESTKTCYVGPAIGGIPLNDLIESAIMMGYTNIYIV